MQSRKLDNFHFFSAELISVKSFLAEGVNSILEEKLQANLKSTADFL